MAVATLVELLDAGVGDEKFSINKIGKFQIGYLKQIFENRNCV